MSVKAVHLFRMDNDAGDYDDGSVDDAFWAR